MQTKEKYLQRMGYTGTPKRDFETLHALQRSHLETIPYENLDIIRGVPLSLEINDIYEKVVVRRRGGYCFELNALFAWLLRGLGFEVIDYFARFLKEETTIPMRRHQVLHVACDDGDFLCDVGVGGTIPRMPLPLTPGKVSRQGNEKYILEEDALLGKVLYEWRRDSWQKMYSFTSEPQLAVDFVAASFYCEKHHDSIFTKQDMVHIFTKEGRKSVAGREVRLFTPDGVQVLHPATEAAYHELLKVHFGIEL